MKDEIVSFETAKLANQLHFSEKTLASYVIKDGSLLNYEIGKLGSYDVSSWNPSYGYTHQDVIAAPTQSLLQRWLREMYGVAIEIRFGMRGGKPYLGYFYGCVYGEHGGGLVKRVNYKDDLPDQNYTYEQALEESLIEALKQL